MLHERYVNNLMRQNINGNERFDLIFSMQQVSNKYKEKTTF